MEQQSAIVEKPTPFSQLKARVEHLRVDANDALSAARHDYERFVSAVRNLQSESALKAFVQGKLKSGGSDSAGAPVIKKAKRAKTAH